MGEELTGIGLWAGGAGGVGIGDGSHGDSITGTRLVAHYHATASGRLTQERIAQQVATLGL